MKSLEKLEIVNRKIAELTKKQKELESKTVDSVSKRVASLLINAN